tara:strand:+ start:35639 stop:37129 length:1491 start_codon:yes stop_codon:yes gene_type:complete
MEFLARMHESLQNHFDKNAFYIDEKFYSYADFAIEISKIRQAIALSVHDSEKIVGLIANDDLYTYASIIALWLEAKAYVPINPSHPIERNEEIIEATEIKYILDSAKGQYKNCQLLNHTYQETVPINIKPKPIEKNDLAYILFTSGSTGAPKGVPISFSNLNAFISAINFDGDFKLKPSDRCLQMFELTFDFSVVSYLFPLLSGACIYTVPRNAIKYFYIYKLLQNHKLTVLSLVPSIIHYLRPYFSEIKAPQVRYCSFGGGALYRDITYEWVKCIPNSKVYNYCGPTENTIYSSGYTINESCKTHNDIISIGKPLPEITYIIIDENNAELPLGEIGELAIAGPQLTPGYWKNDEKNKATFFEKKHQGQILRFYKSGDLCFKDTDENYMYIGRVDFQVKIRGYRIELSEVEFHAKKMAQNTDLIAIDILNKLENTELVLVIASEPFDTSEILTYMKSKLPDYMIPAHIKFLKEFPHNANGKIDRNTLRMLFNQEIP